MKNFLRVIYIFLIMIICAKISNAQTNKSITFNEGSNICSNLISSNNSDSITYNSNDGIQSSYPKNSINPIESQRGNISLGLGFGIPYGILGLCTEYEPIKYIDVTLGLGTVSSIVTWNLGVVGYLFDRESFIRPRLSLCYGNNYSIGYTYGITSMEELCPQSYEYFTGFSIGGGIKMKIIESFNITADLFYVLSNNVIDKTKELESKGNKFVSKDEQPMTFSLGFQYSF